MLNIHILTAGGNVDNVYKKIFPHYKVSKFILLTEAEEPEDVKASIEKMKLGCKESGIPVEIIENEKENIAQLMESIIGLRKNYPVDEAVFYFNVTSGRKDMAIMAFIGSLWTSGIGYYLPKEFKEPLELPAPRIPLDKLQSNKLYQKILIELKKSSGDISQSTLRKTIMKNPNNNKDLSGQTLSQAIDVLKKANLVNLERSGRETLLSLTLAGRVAYSVISGMPKTGK
jgi:DNA-binding transcriptional ArsR family regulator